MSTWLGDIYAASYTAPATSTVVLTVTAPDGTTSNPTVVTTAAPIYTAAVPSPQAGMYLLTWVASGAAVDVFVDQFTAVTPSLALISYSDLKDQLNIAVKDTTGDAKLRRFMQSASDVVQNITGPMMGQQRTEYFDGNSSIVVLSARWVQAIVSISEVLGTASFTLTEQPIGAGNYTQYGYTWDRNTQTIIRRYNGITGTFPVGERNISVTYKQGISPLPQVISDATGELIRWWWQNGQQPRALSFNGASSSFSADDSGVETVMGYAVPHRVIEMLNPFMLGPVSA